MQYFIPASLYILQLFELSLIVVNDTLIAFLYDLGLNEDLGIEKLTIPGFKSRECTGKVLEVAPVAGDNVELLV